MKAHFILTIAILLQVNFCYSQWNQTDGPYGNTFVLSIIPHDSLVLTSTDCGYFYKKTINNNWNLNSTLSFSAFTKIGDSLFIVNNGIKLIDLSNPNNSPTEINSIYLNTLAHSDSCLYGGNQFYGFCKSSNFGNTWSYHNTGLPIDTGSMTFPPYFYIYYNLNSVEVTTNYIFCGTSKGIYRNSGMLSAWTPFNSGLPISKVTFIKSFNDTLFTAMGSILYKSVDFGNNWTLFYTSTSSITSFLKVNNQYFVGSSGNGINYSIDNGISWNTLNTALPDLNITTISYYDSILICGTNSKGVFCFQSGQWISNKSGMICSSIKSIATTNNGLVANDYKSVYISNNGNTWHSANIPSTPTYPNLSSGIGSILTMGDTIFMSYHYSTPGWPYFYSYIKYTIDSCTIWNDLFSNVPFIGNDPFRIYCKNNRLFAYEDDEMYYTDNLGLSWTDISLPSQYCNMFYAFIINNSIPYAAACGNGQLVKLDNTQNWVLSNNGLPTDKEVLALANCDSAIFAYIRVNGMYVSFDNGNNWTNANNGLITNYTIRDFASIGSNLFVTSDSGVFVTNDFGQNWIAINNGLKNLNASSIKILNDTLYVGTFGNGIWKQSITDVHVSVQDYKEHDKTLKIYPNPASDYIHIASNSNKTRFKIIDMVGKEVLSGSLNSSNEINISGIKCGAYIVFIQFDKKVQMTKLLINR
jgi:hypothetical protein